MPRTGSTSLPPAAGRSLCNLSAQGPAARKLANCPEDTQEERRELLPADLPLTSCWTHLCMLTLHIGHLIPKQSHLDHDLGQFALEKTIWTLLGIQTPPSMALKPVSKPRKTSPNQFPQSSESRIAQ
ncbi:hypothetical protein HGM15179_017450, partial [Zosterops borbonicus]